MKRAQRRKYHYLYRITNKLNGKFYIGMHSTDNLDDGYFGSGKRLKYSISKHGKENHEMEILEHYFSREDLAAREKELVNNEMLEDALCLNLHIGGDGGWSHLSVEEKKKFSAMGGKAAGKKSGPLNWKQNLFSVESKEKIRNKRSADNSYGSHWIGRTHSDAAKSKIGAANKLKQAKEANSQFGTCWINNCGQVKKIKKIELQSWLDQGWRTGRK